MCVYRKVEDDLSVCLKTKTPSCIPKKKLKLCICVWTSMTWLRALKSTLPFKIASRNSWETAQLSKRFWDNAPLTVQQFGHKIMSPKFSARLSFLNLLEVPSLFGEYFIFFWWFWKYRAFDYFSQFKCCIKRTSLMAPPSTNWRAWPWQYVKWTQSRLWTLPIQF